MTVTTLDVEKKDLVCKSPSDLEKQRFQLLQETICRGMTAAEIDLFEYHCKRLGLDPHAKQIHPVKRWDSTLRKEVMTVQIGIDGYRLIAERTGRYVPGKEPEFVYNKEGGLVCARSYIKKQTQDGVWHEVCASAHYSEYVALKKDGKPNSMWNTKPHIMLSKCAEAMALRKAFPAELSGLYTKEEMGQADNPTLPQRKAQPKKICTQERYDGFVDAWPTAYGKELIVSYIEKRSSHFKVDVKETVALLIENQQDFEKEFLTWKSKNESSLKENIA